MQNRYKRITLDEIYRILNVMMDEKLEIKYDMDIQEIPGGIGLKMYTKQENIVVCMYPDHPTSQISITRKGMRYIYPKRNIRIKRHTFEEMMHYFMTDDRLFGITKIIELFFIEIIKLEHPDVIESVYLS